MIGRDGNYCRYVAGKLIIRHRGTDYFLHTYPEPYAARRTGFEKESSPLIPDFQVIYSRAALAAAPWSAGKGTSVYPENLAWKYKALECFRYALPQENAAKVERYLTGQWAVYLALHHIPAASDLWQSNQALLHLLASNPAARRAMLGRKWDVLDQVVHRRQRDILAALRLPCQESKVTALRKWVPESCSTETMERLLVGMEADVSVARAVAHLPRLNTGAVTIVLDARCSAVMHPGYLLSIAQDVGEDVVPRTYFPLREVVTMHERLGLRSAVPRISSRETLVRVHDELSCLFQQGKAGRGVPLKFPPPPIPGTESVIPLTDGAMLLEEGRSQHNCVVTYASLVVEGRVYIYRVLAPERATLSIVQVAPGHWRIGQLLAGMNKPVASQTLAAVQQWLLGESITL